MRLGARDAWIAGTLALGFAAVYLATLQGRQSQTKLFHQSERANSAFELIYQTDPDRAPYLMSLSRQNQSDKSLKKVTIPVSHGEAAILETILRTAVARILGW